ncbi:hypothetical protein B0H10DRAFT_2032696 [Mycena sp. CBHHK59/15]|nr:hypothetical protein B0H10DRAFT_2134811 [Mycena sp. CBHHK59/15]KAJ6617503.1 hypothetical protein B0H10DRAFT_2032696 [Mycena sp. CBHHK59/15]
MKGCAWLCKGCVLLICAEQLTVLRAPKQYQVHSSLDSLPLTSKHEQPQNQGLPASWDEMEQELSVLHHRR